MPDRFSKLINKHAPKGGAAARANRAKAVGNLIKCSVCKASKTKEAYSNRQLQRLMDTKENKYAPAGRCIKDPMLTCRSCTSGQVSELTCVICLRTMDLADFGKTQRKVPDRARCLKCKDYHADHEPGLPPPNHDEYLRSSDEEEEEEEDEDFDGASTRNLKDTDYLPGLAGTRIPVDSSALMKYGSRSTSPPMDEDEDEDGWEDYNTKSAGKKKRFTASAMKDENIKATTKEALNSEWLGYGEIIRQRRGEIRPTKTKNKKIDEDSDDPSAFEDERPGDY